MKKILFLAAVAVAAASCTGKNAYTVSGQIDGMDGEYIYMCDIDDPEIVLDSAKVSNGKFKFKGASPTSESIMLRSDMDADEFCYMAAFIEPGCDITVDFGTETAGGSPANDAMTALKDATGALEAEYREAATDEERDAIVARFDALLAETAEANSGNIFGATQLMQSSYNMSAAEIIEAIDAYPDEVRNSTMMVRLREQAEAKLATEPGQPYIDAALPDTEGNTVTLSSVVGKPGNKYVLLDFWATWCGPCMMEVPYLVETYAKYHAKGFEIYGVSLDRSEDAWRNGVKQNKMNWIHVIQPREGAMETVEAYAVQSIPSNFLIETATGKIVAKNLRGEELGATIASLLD